VTIAGRLTLDEIAEHLSLGKATVYAMLNQHIIPAIKVGKRWIVTRHAFEEWEKTCGKEAIVANGENKLTV
jgi:excisionase family DNA binding protein